MSKRFTLGPSGAVMENDKMVFRTSKERASLIVEAVNSYDRLREENTATHDPIRADDVNALLAEVNRLRQVEEKAREVAEDLNRLLTDPRSSVSAPNLFKRNRNLLRLLDAGKGEVMPKGVCNCCGGELDGKTLGCGSLCAPDECDVCGDCSQCCQCDEEADDEQE